MESVITIEHLKKTYPKNVQALKEINLAIEKGEIFGLLGPNGAGKTTLINCIVSLATITSGNIKVMGLDTIEDYIKARQFIGLSPQDPSFDLYFSIWKTLIYQAGYFGIGTSEAKQRAEKLLKLFDLYDKKDKNVKEISGGMKRKFSLAKAMMHEPKILILDEPTAALDVDSRRDLWKYIQKINKQGVTILLTTHYIEEAEELADRICVINKGRIIKLEEKKKIMDTLTRNVIAFTLEKPLTSKSILKAFTIRSKGTTLEIITPRSEQNKTLKKVIDVLDKHNISYHNFEVHEDSLENIFLRIIKNDKQTH